VKKKTIFKSVNIWQSYKQEGGCLMHSVRLATTAKVEESAHDTIHLLASSHAKYSPILLLFSLADSNLS